MEIETGYDLSNETPSSLIPRNVIMKEIKTTIQLYLSKTKTLFEPTPTKKHKDSRLRRTDVAEQRVLK